LRTSSATDASSVAGIFRMSRALADRGGRSDVFCFVRRRAGFQSAAALAAVVFVTQPTAVSPFEQPAWLLFLLKNNIYFNYLI